MGSSMNFRDTLSPAQQTIHDALCDSAWLYGLKYGWNAGIIKDPEQSQAEYSKLSASRSGHLRGYRDAKAALTPTADRTEYERKVAQMKEDFPNGI